MRASGTVAASLGKAVGLLEDLVRRDPGNRGLAAHAPAGQLGPAAFDLLSSRRVAILTGFCIRAAGSGETDGPPGALALGTALRILGKRVTLISDRHSLPLLRAGARASKSAFRILELPDSVEETRNALETFKSAFKPTHILAIERPGSAPDGHRYSMRGQIIDDVAPPADMLFSADRNRGYSTIAIGDGGNELGMGALRDSHSGRVPLGEKIFCASTADYTIAAGISNWGGIALAAALSLLSGVRVLNPVSREREILAAIVEAGGVDGLTGERTLSVDGQAWEEYSRTLGEIHELTEGILGARKGREEVGNEHDN